MVRTGLLSVIGALVLSLSAQAQTAGWKFRWATGQVLNYKAEQTIVASESMGDNKAESKTKVTTGKRWQVLAVDAGGVATLQLSLTALRMETTTPSGEVLLFDSSDLEKSNPQMREQMTKYLNQPLAVLRIDSYGQVLEVKESKFTPASRFDSDLPFQLVVPAGNPVPGSAWSRAYKVTLEPPQGTGEKYAGTQKYVCKSIEAGLATMTVAPTLTNLPEAPADQVPLLQMMPEGEVVFDTANGLMRSARLRIDKELKGHQGEGSSYRFQSTYTEEFVNSK